MSSTHGVRHAHFPNPPVIVQHEKSYRATGRSRSQPYPPSNSTFTSAEPPAASSNGDGMDNSFGTRRPSPSESQGERLPRRDRRQAQFASGRVLRHVDIRATRTRRRMLRAWTKAWEGLEKEVCKPVPLEKVSKYAPTQSQESVRKESARKHFGKAFCCGRWSVASRCGSSTSRICTELSGRCVFIGSLWALCSRCATTRPVTCSTSPRKHSPTFFCRLLSDRIDDWSTSELCCQDALENLCTRMTECSEFCDAPFWLPCENTQPSLSNDNHEHQREKARLENEHDLEVGRTESNSKSCSTRDLMCDYRSVARLQVSRTQNIALGIRRRAARATPKRYRVGDWSCCMS